MSAWLADNRERVFADLTRFLSIASISTDPAFKPKIAEAQRFLLDHLARSGFAHGRLLEGGGPAAVYADWLHAPGKPTGKGLPMWPTNAKFVVVAGIVLLLFGIVRNVPVYPFTILFP